MLLVLKADGDDRWTDLRRQMDCSCWTLTGHRSGADRLAADTVQHTQRGSHSEGKFALKLRSQLIEINASADWDVYIHGNKVTSCRLLELHHQSKHTCSINLHGDHDETQPHLPKLKARHLF